MKNYATQAAAVKNNVFQKSLELKYKMRGKIQGKLNKIGKKIYLFRVFLE